MSQEKYDLRQRPDQEVDDASDLLIGWPAHPFEDKQVLRDVGLYLYTPQSLKDGVIFIRYSEAVE